MKKTMYGNCEIDTLIIANISSEHIPILIKKLNEARFYFTRIASSGGFLRLSTNTLLMGIRQDRYLRSQVTISIFGIELD